MLSVPHLWAPWCLDMMSGHDIDLISEDVLSPLTHIVSVHCREEGCIGKYTPRGPRDFPRAGILHPEKSRGPRWMYFPMHPDSRQCTDILSELAGKYWFCGVTTDGSSISKALICQWREIHSTYMHSALVYIFHHRNSFLPNNAASVSFLDFLPGNNRWRCHQSEFQFKYLLKTI